MSAAVRATIRPPAPQRARFTLEQPRTTIGANVARERESGLTLVQELPALRIGTRMRGEDGRAARISRVALALEQDVPSLVLEVSWDGPVPEDVPIVEVRPSGKGRLRDATIGYEEQSPYAAHATPRSSGWVRRDAAPEPAEAPRESRSDQGTLVFRTVPPAADEPAPERVSQPWMDEPGSELALAVRDLGTRVRTALGILGAALRAALAALRGT